MVHWRKTQHVLLPLIGQKTCIKKAVSHIVSAFPILFYIDGISKHNELLLFNVIMRHVHHFAVVPVGKSRGHINYIDHYLR